MAEALLAIGVDESIADRWRSETHHRYDDGVEMFHEELGLLADKLEAAGL